jgi:hypothetical protein
VKKCHRQFSLKQLMSVLALAALVMFLFKGISDWRNQFRDGYSVRIVTVVLILYLEDKTQGWPRDWDDLSPYFSRAYPGIRSSEIERIKETVWIDFSADIVKMKEDSCHLISPNFCVVSARSGTKFHPFEEANTTIFNFLRDKCNRSPQSRVHLKTNAPSVNDSPPER